MKDEPVKENVCSRIQSGLLSFDCTLSTFSLKASHARLLKKFLKYMKSSKTSQDSEAAFTLCSLSHNSDILAQMHVFLFKSSSEVGALAERR